MSTELQICEFDDLTTQEKSVAIVRLYINDVLQGEGTMQEIADKIGRKVHSLYVGLSRTKTGDARLKKYRVELVEWVRYPVKEYILDREDTWTGEVEHIGIGSMKELAEISGHDECYLRRLSSEKCRESLEKIRTGERSRKRYRLVVVEVEEDG